MKNLIIGYGEIGRAVHEVIGEAGIIDIGRREDIPKFVDVMHVCIPYTEVFEEDVVEYIEEFRPRYIVIWSTVPVGTTEKFGLFAIHSPVEGRHPDLATSIKTGVRWIGASINGVAEHFVKYFEGLGLRVRVAGPSRYTEALKLLSTTEYGVNLVYADYKQRVADEIGMPYELTKEWNQDYNELYKELNEPRFKKFVLDPPEGKIGGHCVVPNAKLLNEDYPNDMLMMIQEMEDV